MADTNKLQNVSVVHFDCNGTEDSLDDCPANYNKKPCRCDLINHSTDIVVQCNKKRVKSKPVTGIAKLEYTKYSEEIYEGGRTRKV